MNKSVQPHAFWSAFVRFAFLLLVLTVASPLLSADAAWHWVKAEYSINGWFVSQGSTDLAVKNGKFEARLFHENSSNDVQIVLEGVVKNGRISATETIQASDHTGSRYTGTWTKKKWDDTARTSGAESINLSDGWSLIGIRRTISN